MIDSSPPWSIPASAPAAKGSCDRYLNINEASKECGLSPSVLRIWELRYGWPNPRRKANGYRSYSPHLVEDLKRMASLVNEGTPIRQLIVDGLPQWPRGEDALPALPRTLDQTRALPCPSGRSESALREELIRAIETHRPGAVLEILQRAAWQLRQKDELDTALAPCVVGLNELNDIGRPLNKERDRQAIASAIEGRCRQLTRMVDREQARIRVFPLHPEDSALAWVICVALARRHHASILSDGSTPGPGECLILASDGIVSGSLVGKSAAVVGSLPSDDRHGLHELLDLQCQPLWIDSIASDSPQAI